MTANVYDFRNPKYAQIANDINFKSFRRGKVIINRCPVCLRYNEIFVDQEDYDLWNEGDSSGRKMIHEVFSWLGDDDREILKTGIHPKCWDNIFSR